jgi:paraquat-inducible protein B
VHQRQHQQHQGLAVLPSVPAASQTIMNDLGKFMKKLNDLPLDEIFADLEMTMNGIDNLVNNPDLRKAIGALNRMLTELATTIELINTGTIPQVNSTLSEVETLVKDMDNLASADSVLYYDLRKS